jgi:hypothetical protein
MRGTWGYGGQTEYCDFNELELKSNCAVATVGKFTLCDRLCPNREPSFISAPIEISLDGEIIFQ